MDVNLKDVGKKFFQQVTSVGLPHGRPKVRAPNNQLLNQQLFEVSQSHLFAGECVRKL